VLQDSALRYESRQAQSIVPSLKQYYDTINIKPTSDDKVQILSFIVCSVIWIVRDVLDTACALKCSIS
jgi:hypothetical protein